MDKLSFKNKVVVITGASAGVGRVTALFFAKYGAKIALLARGIDGLKATQMEIQALGEKSQFYSVDVSDFEKLRDVANQIEQDLGVIDIWINNAMCSVFSPFNKIDQHEYKRVTEVTYLGQVYGTKIALSKMLPRNQGKIILIGSALAYRGIPLQSPYCGAKHAIKGFFESLRCELLHNKKNISLTMIQLPAMNTPQFDWVRNKLPHKAKPMGKIYQPEVAAKAILYAAATNKREIYVGFSTFITIFGNKIIPNFLDKYLAKRGYKGQQTLELNETSKDNVFTPVPGDHGAHGRFNALAHQQGFLWIILFKKLVVGFILFLIIILLWIYK